MSDAVLIAACGRLISAHSRRTEIMQAANCRAMTELEAGEDYNLRSASYEDIGIIKRMAASTLAGCRAKASVIDALDLEDIAPGLARDLLNVVSQDGSVCRRGLNEIS